MKRLASASVAAALAVAIYSAANAAPIAPLPTAAVTESDGVVLAHYYYYYHHHHYYHRYWRHHHYRYW
jgi:type IV secretory pathway protease TraF